MTAPYGGITSRKIPIYLTLYLYDNGEWCPVDRAASAELSVPPDPRRRAHDAEFASIFDHLRMAGFDVRPKEIPNGYHNDRNNAEPWYTFDHDGRKFVVGPRKRVISITVSRETPFSTETLRALAVRDGVTYEADDAWQSTAETAREVTIHAWTADKCVEYLAAAMVVKP